MRTDASKYPKVFLIVLDGFGDGKNSPFNAIQHAHMPFYKDIARRYPRAQLMTCGESVGLPPGVMGNSEVGHMNMGAGRIVYQELTRINKEIRDGDFTRNHEFSETIEAVRKSGGRLHLMGLLSDAGVHSHIDHLKALVRLASQKVPVTIHIFTDGRDTPPTSSEKYVRDLGEFLGQYPGTVIGSVSGRYYAMDRDSRWERVKKAWMTLTGQTTAASHTKGNGVGAALEVIKKSHEANTTDEFIVPTSLAPEAGRGPIVDGDGIIFFNFRADRARELTRAFIDDAFNGFDRGHCPRLARYLCMTQYDKTFALPVAYPPQNLTRILPDVLADHGLRQFRIAETEKYAHVTFFFNGGREQPYAAEERILIPSPKDVPTYDLKPEMSAFEVTEAAAKKLEIGDCHFVLLNYANPDMVGHTGNYDAAVKALVAVDKCLEKSITAALKSGYDVIITSDHGNIEEMHDDHDQPHTQHTLNPVPIHYISNKNKFRVKDGVLADIAPTILDIMGIDKPSEMTQHSLLTGDRE